MYKKIEYEKRFSHDTSEDMIRKRENDGEWETLDIDSNMSNFWNNIDSSKHGEGYDYSSYNVYISKYIFY